MDVAKGQAEPEACDGAAGARPGNKPSSSRAHIVDVATRLFLESSFETVSVDLIAETARISKQTFYARFASKEAVFVAVIRKGANELLVPAVVESARHGPIEANLIRIVIDILKRALTPAAVALERLVSSEAHQFPQLARAYHDNELHARRLIANMFANAMEDGQVRSMDPDFLRRAVPVRPRPRSGARQYPRRQGHESRQGTARAGRARRRPFPGPACRAPAPRRG